MKIAVVTDSTCDLPEVFLDKYNIEVVPLSIHFGEEVYQDGVDLNSREFFQKMQSSEILPGTSQPAMGNFLNRFEKLKENYDSILSIHISKELSGTLQAAQMAANNLKGDIPIKVIDSGSASLGLGFLVLAAARMADKNYSPAEIEDKIENLKKNVSVYFTVNDLTYLKKGGRIGKAQAFLGSILNFNPILELNSETGIISPKEKVRGDSKTRKKMVELGREILSSRGEAWIALIKGDIEQEFIQFDSDFKNMLQKLNLRSSIITNFISPVLGSHVGPYVYGFICVTDDIITELGHFEDLF